MKSMHALPREWKEAISVQDGGLENLLIQCINSSIHSLIKKNKSFVLPNLTAINCTLYKL